MTLQHSMWGDLPTRTNRRTPRSILEEQAEILTKLTDKLLRGRVTFNQLKEARKKSNKLFCVRLYIVATLLDNYQYEVLRVTHGIRLFPADIQGESLSIGKTVKSEEEFSRTIERMLSSREVHDLIAALLAQSADSHEDSS